MPDGSEAPEISVLMTVYNQERYLRRAIDSVLTQTLRQLELVLINDGSTDASPAIMAEYAGRDARIVIRHQPANGGVPRALNDGLAMAGGSYVGLLDGDDIALPNRFEKQLAFLRANPAVGMVGGSMIIIDTNDRKLRLVRYPTGPATLYSTVARGSVIAGPTPLMRRECLEKLGGWRTGFLFAQDYDLSLRMADIAQLDNLEDVVIYYRLHIMQSTARHRARQDAEADIARFSAGARRRNMPDPIGADTPIDASTIDTFGLISSEADRLRELLLRPPAR